MWIADASIPYGKTQNDNMYVMSAWSDVTGSPGFTKLGFLHNTSGNWLYFDGHASSQKDSVPRSNAVLGR